MKLTLQPQLISRVSILLVVLDLLLTFFKTLLLTHMKLMRMALTPAMQSSMAMAALKIFMVWMMGRSITSSKLMITTLCWQKRVKMHLTISQSMPWGQIILLMTLMTDQVALIILSPLPPPSLITFI